MKQTRKEQAFKCTGCKERGDYDSMLKHLQDCKPYLKPLEGVSVEVEVEE